MSKVANSLPLPAAADCGACGQGPRRYALPDGRLVCRYCYGLWRVFGEVSG